MAELPASGTVTLCSRTERRVAESWPRIMRLATALEAERFLTHDDVENVLSDL
jgi:hypothetical protein